VQLLTVEHKPRNTQCIIYQIQTLIGALKLIHDVETMKFIKGSYMFYRLDRIFFCIMITLYDKSCS
jgi:hypothetical protein